MDEYLRLLERQGLHDPSARNRLRVEHVRLGRPSLCETETDYVLHNVPFGTAKFVLSKIQKEDVQDPREYDGRLPTARSFYQFARGLHILRDDPLYSESVSGCVNMLRSSHWPFGVWSPLAKLFLADRLSFEYQSGRMAVVTRNEGAGMHQRRIEIPCEVGHQPNTDYSLITLAHEQPSESEAPPAIPSEVMPTLETLLGDGFTDAGGILQYLAPTRNDGSKPRVVFALPNMPARHHQRCAVIAFDEDHNQFHLRISEHASGRYRPREMQSNY